MSETTRPATTAKQEKCSHPPDAQRHLWASGNNKRRYPVKVCTRCGRLTFDLDDRPQPPLRKTLYAPPARQLPLSLLMKAIAEGCYRDPASCQLRWVTLHPNGEDSVGHPFLVHDNGDSYTIVGGGGGRLDQLVLPKTGKRDKKKARSEKSKSAPIEPDSEEAKALKEKAGALRAEAKARETAMVQRALEKLSEKGGAFEGNTLDEIERAARQRAVKEKGNATESEKQEFADRAAEEARSEAHSAVKKLVAQALDAQARQQLGDSPSDQPVTVRALMNGRQLVRHLVKKDLDAFVADVADIANLRAQARAISRALANPEPKMLSTLAADVRPLSQEEADQQNISKYLDGKRVDANVNLIWGAEQASARTQNLHQTLGASDGINYFVSSQAGSAILSPDKIRAIGIENAARVATAYLAGEGHDLKADAEKMQQRIVATGYGAAKAVLDQCAARDAQAENAKRAAEGDDGTLTKTQASLIAANMAVDKYRLLNVARGQLRAAATLGYTMQHGVGDQPMVLDGGHTAVGAYAFARGLGLQDDQFTVNKGGEAVDEGHEGRGAYRVEIPAQHIGALARPHSQQEADRNADMDALRNDVETNPGDWQPEGFNDTIHLRPHQELAIRAGLKEKRMVYNLSPGSGKTAVAFGLASELLNSGACDRGLITMPAKPRAQQNDYYDEEDLDENGQPKKKQGERHKYMKPEMADKVVVIESGDHLAKVLAGIDSGGPSVLVISPDLMRDKLEQLKAAGFGGEKSFAFLDEAHEFAIGETEGAGSQRARAAREIAKSPHFYAASGTLIENNSSELWSIYDLVHPGALGSQKEFSGEWKRLAQGGQNFFSGEAMRQMRDRLSGGMLSYAKGVTGEDGEPLELTKNVVTVPVAPEQKAAIAKLQQQYLKDRASDDKNVRDSASLALYGRVLRVLNNGVKGKDGRLVNPKMEALQRIMESEKARDPKARVGVYSDELAPLRAAREHLKGRRLVQVTGAEDDGQVREAVGAVNNRDNDTDGILLSRAGNYGLNLQGGDHMVKLHAMLTPSREKQVDARIFRHGQTRNVRATTILTDHPFEQMAQFRTTQQKFPEMSLLAALSEDQFNQVGPQ